MSTPSKDHSSTTPMPTTTTLIEVSRPPAQASHRSEPTLVQSFKAIALSSWFNPLLVFIPISWAFHYARPEDDVLIFIFSFLAIVPLAQLLGFATEELSLRVGQTLAGLLNATLGNAVELIVAIIALLKCELRLVQSSLIGSILSNLLLVLGMCFFAGGTRFAEQGFSTGAAQINTSLLTLSGTAVLLPAFLFYAMTAGTTLTGSSLVAAEKTASLDILKISHGAAILLLFTYGCYLYFQLRSHAYMYEDVNNPDVATSLKFGERRCPTPSASILSLSPSEAERVPILTRATPIGPGAFEAAHIAAQDDEEVPTISILACTILLAAVTALVALTSEFLVDSINGLSVKSGIGKEFIGLILLPIVGNAAEHWTAVTVSVKDKLTLSIGVAVGSSIQIALFVIPFIVSLGWAIGTPMTMFFDPFESAVLFLSVITVNYVIQDGKSNWLEGVILMVLYVVIGVCVFFYGGTEAILSC